MLELELVEEPVRVRVFPGGRILRRDGARILGVHPTSCTKLEQSGELTVLQVGSKKFHLLKEVKRLAGIAE